MADPFRSKAAAFVLGQLILGYKTSKKIAQMLNQTPPSIVEQLNNLRKAGIINYGEKKGKLQLYEVNWEKTILRFINRAPCLISASIVEDSEIRQRVDDLKRGICKNKRFESLLKEYLIITLTNIYLPMPLVEAAEIFEDSLIRLFPKIKKESVMDQETRELLELLEIWYGIAFNMKSRVGGDALGNALKKLGLL